MMYTHTITAYRPDGELDATIDDAVDLSRFGIDGHPGTSRGAPVEAAFTSDGAHVYVSNYSMYGAGFGPEGLDSCTAVGRHRHELRLPGRHAHQARSTRSSRSVRCPSTSRSPPTTGPCW